MPRIPTGAAQEIALMSQNRKLTSLVSVFALFGATGLLAAACGNKVGGDGGGSCAEISGRVSALQASAKALTDVSASVRTDVVAACAQIAGMPAPTGVPSDADLKTNCDAAKLVVDGAIKGSVQLVVVPPVCTVDAQAQLACEGSCTAKADVECDPGSVDVRCDPGELSVECSGTCNVDASCEGTAPNVQIDCTGECTGTCSGTCSGTCTGTCSGECTVITRTAPATVNARARARAAARRTARASVAAAARSRPAAA